MRIITFCLLFFATIWTNAQTVQGQIYMKEDSYVFLNQIFVTNIKDHKTILSNYNGEFVIPAKVGDVIRFTSIVTDRKDIIVTPEILANPKFYVELKPSYYEIQEIVIRFKPTGNLRTDVLALKKNEKSLEIAKMVGLPQPKGDGTSPTAPAAALAGGGLTFSIDTIYDIISGDQKKKKRLYDYEKMSRNLNTMKNYFGEEYFTKLKIPKNLIDNFLQFVYSSDHISTFIEVGNIEATKPSIEKYVPIYLKRLRNSNLMEVID